MPDLVLKAFVVSEWATKFDFSFKLSVDLPTVSQVLVKQRLRYRLLLKCLASLCRFTLKPPVISADLVQPFGIRHFCLAPCFPHRPMVPYDSPQVA